MILVDTSVWIAAFRKDKPLDIEAPVDFDEIATCFPLVQEALQGFRDERAFRRAEESVHALPVVESPMHRVVFDDAVRLIRTARRAGLTIRSSTDCLIAAYALRNDLGVLHIDRDYDAIARIAPLRARPAPRGGRRSRARPLARAVADGVSRSRSKMPWNSRRVGKGSADADVAQGREVGMLGLLQGRQHAKVVDTHDGIPWSAFAPRPVLRGAHRRRRVLLRLRRR